MDFARRTLRQTLVLALAVVTLGYGLSAQEKARLRVDDYVIDAEIVPAKKQLIATAKVRFTALEDVATAVFELHNGLRPAKVTGADGKPLAVERVIQDSTVRVALPTGLTKDHETTLTFQYEGSLAGAADSPVEGLKLASIDSDISYLLYAGRWFPVNNFGINRFTSTINVTAPAALKVIGSGQQGAPKVSGAKQTVTFVWNKPSFPGTIIAGTFVEASANAGAQTIRTYLTPKNREFAAEYATTALKEFEYFTGLYGAPPSNLLQVVEIPNDTVPTAWAPEIAAISTRGVTSKTNYRLLANTVARQWWGVSISAASRNDMWINDGFARYSEMRYVENAAGQAGFEEATRDMAVGALAYDTIPLASIGKLDMFSPEFQSLTTDKGGMILHMLRWSVGDANFDNTMKAFYTQFAGKPVRTADFRQVAEKTSGGEDLTAFFSQWLEGTGAPEFKIKYTVYRAQKGFRVVGEITQDLDLFRMPVEVHIDTDGKTETQRIDVVGTNSTFAIDTFGKPRRITLDPNNWVLKNSPDLKVRVAILRGQQLVAQGDLAEALVEFRKALEVNKLSSLAQYRIGEVFFLQRNYQSAANAYRDALNGDQEPKWTEVWSHIQLGKIFDITGQRERAVNEYRQALQTNDNTQGAQDEARRYIAEPFKRTTENAGY